MPPARTPKAKRSGKTGRGSQRAASPRSADALAAGQREISISEFFAKNRHLLGFDNPRKALLTTIKEAVDNALDACEEAGVLPEILVRIEHLPAVDENRYRVTVQDNGPGVVRKQIDNIFGKLLYGSKFHHLKMSRGQQGIGISAAGMYGLMTTGKPMVVVTRSKKGRPAHHVELAMDTAKNRPEVTVDRQTEDFPPHTGTRVTIELEGRYTKGRTSVDEYLEQTAIANPHARIIYQPPTRDQCDHQEQLDTQHADGESQSPGIPIPGLLRPDLDSIDATTKIGEAIVFPRTIEELPDEPLEIKPHPRGVELGALMRMLKQTDEKNLGPFLQKEFCRVGPGKAKQICDKARVTTRTWVSAVDHAQAEALHRAIQHTSLIAPPLDCLAPIGAKQILAGLLKGVPAEFYTASTRPPAVYRGNPFQIEVGLAFGGKLPAEQSARVIRFANRVPLLYQQSACASFKAVVETKWKNYGLSQQRASAPVGPLVVMIHMASVWVPFTSESKEAIADYDEIRKEMRLALQECGRKLGMYLRRRQRARRQRDRRSVYLRYIGEIALALHAIDPSINAQSVRDDLLAAATRLTALADQQFDEDGNPISPEAASPADTPEPDADTIIVDRDEDGPTPSQMNTKKRTNRTTARAPRSRSNGSAPARKKMRRARKASADETLF